MHSPIATCNNIFYLYWTLSGSTSEHITYLVLPACPWHVVWIHTTIISLKYLNVWGGLQRGQKLKSNWIFLMKNDLFSKNNLVYMTLFCFIYRQKWHSQRSQNWWCPALQLAFQWHRMNPERRPIFIQQGIFSLHVKFVETKHLDITLGHCLVRLVRCEFIL